ELKAALQPNVGGELRVVVPARIGGGAQARFGAARRPAHGRTALPAHGSRSAPLVRERAADLARELSPGDAFARWAFPGADEEPDQHQRSGNDEGQDAELPGSAEPFDLRARDVPEERRPNREGDRPEREQAEDRMEHPAKRARGRLAGGARDGLGG